jgi:hypothetical protein
MGKVPVRTNVHTPVTIALTEWEGLASMRSHPACRYRSTGVRGGLRVRDRTASPRFSCAGLAGYYLKCWNSRPSPYGFGSNY